MYLNKFNIKFKNSYRVGRGYGSGVGRTCRKGHKGQKARKSGNVRPGFEGGQNPLMRRLPKRGFTNSPFKVDSRAVNVGLISDRFAAGAIVDRAALIVAGLISSGSSPIKVLGKGNISHAITLRVNAISISAREAVQNAGGTVEIVKG